MYGFDWKKSLNDVNANELSTSCRVYTCRNMQQTETQIETTQCQRTWHVSCAHGYKTNQHCPTVVHMKLFFLHCSTSGGAVFPQHPKRKGRCNMFSLAGVKLTQSFVMVISLDMPVDFTSAGAFVVPLLSMSLSCTRSKIVAKESRQHLICSHSDHTFFRSYTPLLQEECFQVDVSRLARRTITLDHADADGRS